MLVAGEVATFKFKGELRSGSCNRRGKKTGVPRLPGRNRTQMQDKGIVE